MTNDNYLIDGQKYIFSLLRIDVEGHSRLYDSYLSVLIDNSLIEFRKMVETEIRTSSGNLCLWAGDGGLYFFYGEEIEERATQAALRIMRNMSKINRRISNKNQDRPKLKVRIAVHQGSVRYREDAGNMRGKPLNFISHLESRLTATNCIAVSEDIFFGLAPETRELFQHGGEYEGKTIYSHDPCSSELQTEVEL